MFIKINFLYFITSSKMCIYQTRVDPTLLKCNLAHILVCNQAKSSNYIGSQAKKSLWQLIICFIELLSVYLYTVFDSPDPEVTLNSNGMSLYQHILKQSYHRIHAKSLQLISYYSHVQGCNLL